MEVQVHEVGGLQLSWDSNSGAASEPTSSSLHSGPSGCMKCLHDLFMTLLLGAVDRIARGVMVRCPPSRSLSDWNNLEMGGGGVKGTKPEGLTFLKRLKFSITFKWDHRFRLGD